MVAELAESFGRAALTESLGDFRYALCHHRFRGGNSATWLFTGHSCRIFLQTLADNTCGHRSAVAATVACGLGYLPLEICVYIRSMPCRSVHARCVGQC